MSEESLADVAIAYLIAGIACSILALSKLGAIDFLLSGAELPQIPIQRMQKEAAEVDLAEIPPGEPEHVEPHAAASKSDRPE